MSSDHKSNPPKHLIASFPVSPTHPSTPRNILAREKLERSLQTRASLQSSSLRNFHYRSNRLHGHSHPAVGSGPKHSLAPSQTHFLPIEARRKGPPMIGRKCESAHDPLPLMTPVATFVTCDDVTGVASVASPTPPTLRSLPITKPKLHRQRLTHERDAPSLFKTRLTIRYKPPTPPTHSHYKATSPLTSSYTSPSPPLSARTDFERRSKSYRAQLQSYFAPRRGDVSLIGRKIAPVLRVPPASSRIPSKSAVTAQKQCEKKNNEAEVTSQKRVRFSDQVGFPLVRNMTPNYRRKHSYILRWLETAGRTGQALV